MKKALSFLLVLAMVCSLAACGSKQEETKQSSTQEKSSSVSEESTVESTEEVKEPVKITLYPFNANLTSGTVGGWLGEYLLEKGYILDIWSYSDDKLNAMLSSGDLPDIMYLQSGKVDIKELGKNGMLLDMDDYADKLPNLMNNDQMQIAMNYVREYVTDGNLVVLPTQVGQSMVAVDTERNAVKLNWPVYEEIGAPQFKNLDELIPILKKMQEAHPALEDGTKTYGMHLYTTKGFDPINNIFYVTGHASSFLKYGIEVDQVEEKLNYIFEDDSMFKYALTFMNKLYREGLLDPDSMTTERTAQHKKIEAGAALAGWGAVPGWEYSGYYPVWFDEVETAYSLEGFPYGNNAFIAVNPKAENVDAVVDFVNLLADPEVERVLTNGPQGELWDVDASGKVYVTEKGLGWWVDGTPAVLKNGETFSIFNSPLFWGQADLSVDGQLIALNYADEVLAAKADSEVNQMWQKTTGYQNYMEMIQDKGTVITAAFNNNVTKFTEAVSDEQNLILSAIQTALTNAMWKMIYAESDAQFEEIWDEVVEECEGLGIEEMRDWQIKNIEQALEKKAALAK